MNSAGRGANGAAAGAGRRAGRGGAAPAPAAGPGGGRPAAGDRRGARSGRGRSCPPERLLCEQLGVSRTVIREAVRSLAAKGLVDVRPGGGVWVRQPTAGPAAELLGIAMQTAGGGVTWADVLEIRRLVEVEAAGRAAERRTGADLQPAGGHPRDAPGVPGRRRGRGRRRTCASTRPWPRRPTTL